MSNLKTNTQEAGNKVRLSIVNKLSNRLFFRLMGIFLMLDLLICMLAAGSIIIFSEQKASHLAEIIYETGIPENDALDWLAASSVTITTHTGYPDGLTIPWYLRDLISDYTASGTRKLASFSTNYVNTIDMISGLSYVVAFQRDGATIEISVNIGAFCFLFITAFAFLIFIQLLILLSRAIKDARLIRKTLDPIAALAKAAQTLNRIENQFDPKIMAALEGKLEGINASKLDTRIPVDGMQEELKNLARAINGMLDRINESYRAQIRFVSDASHELRTPISVIQGYANLLDRWGKNDEKTLQESIIAIKDEATNMKDLVEQLLFLARGDNNTIALNIETFNLSQLTEEVIRETELIDCAHHYSKKLTDVLISADKALLKQLLRILVDNAIKYTDANGAITVSVLLDGEHVKLSVQDDGIGIKPEAIPRIFDRFYRTDESRTRATGGAGLGLSIAKWIAYRHGGQMEVLSREGIGTRITIILPHMIVETSILFEEAEENLTAE